MGFAESDDADDDKYATLSPSDRSYTIPENWLNPDLDDYIFFLLEYSFEIDGKFGAIAGIAAAAGYYEDVKSLNIDDKLIHQQIKNIVKNNHQYIY